MIWKMRAVAGLMAVIGLVVWLRPLSATIEAGLLVLGLAGAAYYVKMHRQFYAAKDQPTDSSSVDVQD